MTARSLKPLIIGLVAVVVLAGLAPVAVAKDLEDCPVYQGMIARRRAPATGPLVRAGHGVKDIVLSPVEIPATMLRAAAQRGPVYGLIAGGLEGVGNGLTRLTAGVIELVGSPVPGNRMPLYNKRLGQRALPTMRPPRRVTRP